MSVLLQGCTTWTNKTTGEKTREKLHKDAAYYFKEILEAAPYKTAVELPLIYITNCYIPYL